MLFLNLLLILSKVKLWLDLLKNTISIWIPCIILINIVEWFLCTTESSTLQRDNSRFSEIKPWLLTYSDRYALSTKEFVVGPTKPRMLLMVEWLLWAVDVIVVALDIAIFAIVRRRWYCKSVRLYGLSVIGVWININKWSSSTNNKRWREPNEKESDFT